MIYFKQGEYEQALPLYQQGLAINEKTLGLEHPQTATNLQNIAKLYQAQGKYKEVQPLYKQALAIVKKTLNKEDPLYKRVCENYSSLLEEMKQIQA